MNLNSTAVRKILPLLALRPGEGFTLTDICRFAGLDTKSVAQVLERFRTEGFLLDNAYGPRTYSANPAYPMFPEIKTIALRLLGLPDSILASGGQTSLMAVFGSLLRPTYGRDSDIDILVVTKTPAAARQGLEQASARLGKAISAQVYSPARFSNALSRNDPFVREIFERPHAILAGSLEHFGAQAVTSDRPMAERVRLAKDCFWVYLADGRVLGVPYARFSPLARASAEQRRGFVLDERGRSLHWPALDEDISIELLLYYTPSLAESASAQADPRGGRRRIVLPVG